MIMVVYSMKKIKSLFKKDYEGNGLAYNEVVTGSEWVINGEGVPTIKWDGTCCMIKDGELYKRYDRKLTKSAARKRKNDPVFVPIITDFKVAPDGWLAAEDEPDVYTGHWPGWLKVDFDLPENKWHKAGWLDFTEQYPEPSDGTYELIGTKVQGNPYDIDFHTLMGHGWDTLTVHFVFTEPPRTFNEFKLWFAENEIEGIVWHHPDGRMVKLKRSDFGLSW